MHHRIAITLAVLAGVSCGIAHATGPSTQPAANGGGPLSPTDEMWLRMSRAMEKEKTGVGDDPMRTVSTGMADIAADLDAELTGKPVQAKQAKVVSQLDLLIKELEKQCSGSGSGGGLNPSKPMAKSTLAGGPGGINELHDPKASEKQWGALKPHEREQILQSKTDGFPQGYESLLQSYYRRLASEESVAEVPAPATPNESRGPVQP